MYIDGCTPIVTSAIIALRNKQLLHPAQTSYREEVDYDPVRDLWVMNRYLVMQAHRNNRHEHKTFIMAEQWPFTSKR